MTLLLAGLAVAQDPAALSARWGEGARVKGEDLEVQVRARAQLRASILDPGLEAEPLEPAFAVRRMRIALTARNPSRDLTFYVQLGLAPQDMESDLLVPLRDAVVIWTPTRDLNVRAGQHKVPFNRERVVSSGALQFVDRSIVNAALNLDRDVGVQLFSEDLFGLGQRLGYAVGLYNGDGRNRFAGDPGVLTVARLELRPLGAFADSLAQGDLESGEGKPRLQLGVAVAQNADTVRERSTTGDTLGAPFTYEHGAADLLFKGGGFSLHAEGIVRRADAERRTSQDTGEVVTSGSAWGWTVMGGYLLPGGWEPVARYAEVQPLASMESAVEDETEARLGLNWYVQGHDLKVQLDGARLGGSAHPEGNLEARLQTQVFF